MPGTVISRLRTTAAQDLALAAIAEGTAALREVPDSDDKRFLLEAARYVVARDHSLSR